MAIYMEISVSGWYDVHVLLYIVLNKIFKALTCWQYTHLYLLIEIQMSK